MEREINVQEYDMNVRPELGKWASLKQKAKLKLIRAKEYATDKKEKLSDLKEKTKLKTTQIKESVKNLKNKRTEAKEKETEMIANGQTTRKEVLVKSAWAAVQGAITLGGIALGTTTALPLIGFVAGLATAVSMTATIINYKDAKDAYKKYRQENPKVKKTKVKKEKKNKKKKLKELKITKGINKILNKFKKKSDDNEVVTQEPELVMPIPSEEMDETPELVVPTAEEVKEEKESTFKLDKNSPEIVSIDLSNINIQPGLNIVPYHFIIRKEDEVMNEIISQYIEKTTGCPAMYEDEIIDNQEKRVYMLNK